MKPTSRLHQNQGRAYAKALYYLCSQIFTTRKPADRVVAAYFRQNKRLGSTDRRFISESLFSIFRWWGWLRLMPGVDDRLWQAADGEGDAPRTFERLALMAHLFDTPELLPPALAWKQHLEIEAFLDTVSGLDLAGKAHKFAEWEKLPKPPTPTQLLPNWIMKAMPRRRSGLNELIESMQKRPPMWLRAQVPNPADLMAELETAGLRAEQSKLLPTAIKCVNPRVNLYEVDAFRKGRFEVQDFASQVIGLACQAKPGQRWWDVCAGAGGKSLQLGHAMQSKGTLLATDIRGYKLEDLRKRARRSGLSNIRTKAWDGEHMPSKHLEFDGVLVDAPCSNSGTWRRNPDARWTVTAADIDELSAIQAQLIRRVARAVKPGGVLVYATCSLCQAENEDVVQGFLAEHPEFATETLVHPVSGDQLPGMLRMWPNEADSDATFVARLRRAKAGPKKKTSPPAAG